MTPIKDFRRTILCYFSFSQRLWFSCFVVRWSVYSSRLKELHRRLVWELRTHMKKKKEAVMRWIIYKRNKYLDAFTENSNKNELSVPSLYIGQVMAMKLSGMFSYGWNQIWTSKLSAVKRIAVWRVLESIDLWRWQRELGAHILEAITLNVLRYARHPEFLIATSLEWLL